MKLVYTAIVEQNVSEFFMWDCGATGWDAPHLGCGRRESCGGSNPFYPTIGGATTDWGSQFDSGEFV